ncbi:MAG: NUDIX domain-containing protein [Tannerellaceae bacterium]|jgi:hypothetical protein|nr:NUDIX domain-containing protein [Tannerellaceae bacterium]
MDEPTGKVTLANAEEYCPGISLDCVIFGFHEGSLKVLLNKFTTYSKWMLPGGFIYKEEDVDDAAARTLVSRTGLANVYLRQFYLFGDVKRTSITENEDLMVRQGFGLEEKHISEWFLQRFFSIGYYAFVEYGKATLQSNIDENVTWFDLNDIPPLYADHNCIIEKAISNIRSQLNSIPIGYELLPEKFTLTQLRIIYETILGEKLDRRNFQRKILSAGLVCKLDEVYKKWGQKSSALYSFDKQKYKDAIKNGIPVF